MSGNNRVFTREFKEGVARRIVDGESVSALHQEFQIKGSVLYRLRDAYRSAKPGTSMIRACQGETELSPHFLEGVPEALQ